MKTAGSILSSLFDEQFVKKAQGYTNLFDSWADITAKNGIAEAANHSRIKELERGILLVEMDHPGWKQILQTKQKELIKDYNIRFPEMKISGISLMLGRSKPARSAGEKQTETTEYPPIPEQTFEAHEPSPADYGAIKDDDLREKLIKIGQAIAEREKGST
ncbi:MAG: DUF721 domain-containing protein [Treponema sp.]|nr:DUF721 domain-containing protein [Treponema sp.]